MPNRGQGEGQDGRAETHAPKRLIAELRQPLTAASNYIGIARAIIRSGKDIPIEVMAKNLDKAGEQILRAGQIASQLQESIDRSGR